MSRSTQSTSPCSSSRRGATAAASDFSMAVRMVSSSAGLLARSYTAATADASGPGRASSACRVTADIVSHRSGHACLYLDGEPRTAAVHTRYGTPPVAVVDGKSRPIETLYASLICKEAAVCWRHAVLSQPRAVPTVHRSHSHVKPYEPCSHSRRHFSGANTSSPR